jgi:hypothetical protein
VTKTRAYWRQLYAQYWGETPAWPPPPPPESLGELGEEARKLLENPVLHEALGRIETKLVASWRGSAVGDDEAREAAYRLHWAVEQLKAELRLMIANASMQGRQ